MPISKCKNMERYKAKTKTKDEEKTDSVIKKDTSLGKKPKVHYKHIYSIAFLSLIYGITLFIVAYFASRYNWCNIKFALEVAGAPFVIALIGFMLQGENSN